MADIEAMFYQMKAKIFHINSLRDTLSKVEENTMTVPMFEKIDL